MQEFMVQIPSYLPFKGDEFCLGFHEQNNREYLSIVYSLYFTNIQTRVTKKDVAETRHSGSAKLDEY